jgi:serine/threonine protein phosphatase PrpC
VVADLTGGSVLDEQRIAKFEVGRRGVLLAVSDGLGGHRAGEVASAQTVRCGRPRGFPDETEWGPR